MSKLVVCILSLAVLASCKPKTNSTENEEVKLINDIGRLIEDLPDPSAIPFTLKAIDASFADSLVNSLDNLESYKGDEDKLALNMGVYAADVSYLAAFEKPELTMKYVQACHSIGEELGDSSIFKNDLLENIEANLGNHDALSMLLRGMIVETSIQLEKDHHMSMAALALTGSFIEELFQAVNVIDNYHLAGMSKDQSKEKIEPLVQLVMGQEQPLLDLIQLIKDIPQDDTIRGILLQLTILENLYKGELATIKENMEADPDYIADRRVMKAITLEIEGIREGIVN
ncbi:MAG: hypothetical protein GY816_02150 [Cytophagales bacterium]|nr:hypothetical protein [Cytophagales bacterium]